MGRFLLGLSILTLFLTAGLFINAYIGSTCNPLIADLEIAVTEPLANAEKRAEQAAQKWQRKRPLLAVFFDHAPLSSIDEGFAQLAVCKDEDDFFTTCAILREKLSALASTHKPTVENIL